MDITEARNFNILLQQRHPWERARLEVIWYLICQLPTPSLEEPLLVLDLGCGDAFVLGELSRRMPLSKFIAVDNAYTDESLRLLKEQYHDRRIEFYKSIREIELPGRTMDIVMLLDVLEHIENDTEFLQALVRDQYIGSDTQFLITVPAFQGLFSSHDVFLKHFRRYNNRTLKKCILQSGLEISRVGYFFFLLLFPRFLKVLLEKFLQPRIEDEKGIGAWRSHRFIDELLVKILLADFNITECLRSCGINVAGLSNFAICQKRL